MLLFGPIFEKLKDVTECISATNYRTRIEETFERPFPFIYIIFVLSLPAPQWDVGKT